jgi:hypothetical protein
MRFNRWAVGPVGPWRTRARSVVEERRNDRMDDAAVWAEERLGFRADEVQKDLLARGGHRLILNCTRQWGKSTVTAAKAVHTAYSHAGMETTRFRWRYRMGRGLWGCRGRKARCAGFRRCRCW